jgi:malonyl-CoA O-methyltransferase
MNRSDDNLTLNTRDVQRRFDRAATGFDAADFVHAVARNGLITRLQPMQIRPGTIIDLGAATGAGSRLLRKQFRRARIIAIDLSGEMLGQARRKRSWFSKISMVQADARAMPVVEHGVDLVFANLLLPWIDNIAGLFHEIGRVLRKDGLFLFSTLGPDSLFDLRQAWQSVDNHAHVNRFPDMHDIGDALVGAGFLDPVLDADRLTITYSGVEGLFRDLTAAGARNSLAQRNPALVSRSRFRTVQAALEERMNNSLLAVELEFVYGHCWSAGSRETGAEFHIDARAIGRRRSRAGDT